MTNIVGDRTPCKIPASGQDPCAQVDINSRCVGKFCTCLASGSGPDFPPYPKCRAPCWGPDNPEKQQATCQKKGLGFPCGTFDTCNSKGEECWVNSTTGYCCDGYPGDSEVLCCQKGNFNFPKKSNYCIPCNDSNPPGGIPNCQTATCPGSSLPTCTTCNKGWAEPDCKTCAKGWAEPDCTTCAKHYYSSGGDCKPCPACSSHGTCDESGSGCECDQGWTGDTCDDCTTCDTCNTKCNNGGTCNNGNPPTCDCKPNWAGDTCDDCKPTWTGPDCKTCANGYYLSGGKCITNYSCQKNFCQKSACDTASSNCFINDYKCGGKCKPPPKNPPKKPSGLSTEAIIGISIAGGVLLIILIVIAVIASKKPKGGMGNGSIPKNL